MSMIIAHNIPALNASKNLYNTNKSFNSSLAKLSSGYRINKGSDGPADLVVSEQLRAQIGGLERAVRNTTESINVLSIAEGALNEMNSILKKMKALAIHAANNGVTSPDQVAADQSEMDSGIQTLERIANTTKYSDQFLLNGAKDLTYSVDTKIVGTQNNKMVNESLTDFNQIYKREGYQVAIGFNGTEAPDKKTATGNAAMSMQASKAYLEIDAFKGTKSQVTEDGKLTQAQKFILTGSLGSQQFDLSAGAHVSDIVTRIHNAASSTGVDASLIFNRSQMINQSVAASTATAIGLKSDTANSSATIYDNYTANATTGKKERILSASGAITGVEYGKNTDGQGFIYVKLVGNGASAAYELYKDASMSKESLIGTGIAGGTFEAKNNSGLTAFSITNDKGKYGDVVRISTGNVALNSGNACVSSTSTTSTFDANNSTAAGVQLGVNTSSNGSIYIKTVFDKTGQKAMVYAYNNSLMRQEDLVAQTANYVSLAATGSVILDSIWNDEKTANTGLGLTLNIRSAITDDAKKNTEETFSITFSNLGARIYASEYGSDHSIKVQQFDGGIFTHYDDPGSYDSAKLIKAGDTFITKGQDATVTVNGQTTKTKGLTLNLSTPDLMADITFNAGRTGTTTIAQVGYGEGSIFSKATSLTFDFDKAGGDQGSNSTKNTHYSAKLNNANHVTSETIGNFQGGMQLQLGEGAGDQERTIIALKSMSTANLGRMEVTQRFDKSKAIVETKTVSIQDVMGGHIADLSSDPALAMRIVDKAINDVSTLRAQIGAVQGNMLQTNENNLRVAIENLTKTESDIRDTDMASEMTEFTKQQIMSNAGISMLAQANNNSQSVMALLGS